MRLAPLVFILVCALVLFTGFDRVGLVDEREARDAEVARELISREEVLTPLVGTESWFEKPLLAYAPEALVRLEPGSADLNSRRLRALFAVVLLILTASVAAEHFGARAGWISALVLATSLATPLASRTDGTQLIGSLLGWVGCAGLADSIFGRRAGQGPRLLVTYASLAAALVVVGPLPALWPFGGLALYLVLARTPGDWHRVQPLAGLAFMAGLALPWYGAMIERHGAAFLAHAPFFPYAIQPRGPWFAGPILVLSMLVVGFFPWSSLLPGAILHAATGWRAARRPLPHASTAEEPSRTDPIVREQREESAAHYFIACVIAALAPIIVYPSPPLPAALPALPAAAILCGRFLDHLFEDAERVAAPFSRAMRMLALFGTAGALLLAVVASRVWGAVPELRLLATVVFVTSWAPFLANFLGRRRLAAALMMLPVVVGTPVATLRLVPAMEDYLNVREVAQAMASASPDRAPLVLVELPPPSLRLYTRRNLVVADSLGTSLARYRASDGLTYLAFRPAREREVARATQTPLEIMLRTPSMVLARVRPS